MGEETKKCPRCKVPYLKTEVPWVVCIVCSREVCKYCAIGAKCHDCYFGKK